MALAGTNSFCSVKSEPSLGKSDKNSYDNVYAVQPEKDLRTAISEAYGLPETYNFWAPEAYRQAYVRRFDAGKTCAEAIVGLLVDRVALEKQVADLYRKWAKSANSLINNCALPYTSIHS